MGGCCTSGARDESLDQKEDKLAAGEVKKEEGAAIEERAGRGPMEERDEPQDSPDDLEFKGKIVEIKSPNEVTNVRTHFKNDLEHDGKTWKFQI
jgi:hypothetical protein